MMRRLQHGEHERYYANEVVYEMLAGGPLTSTWRLALHDVGLSHHARRWCDGRRDCSSSTRRVQRSARGTGCTRPSAHDWLDV